MTPGDIIFIGLLNLVTLVTLSFVTIAGTNQIIESIEDNNSECQVEEK